MTTIGVFVSRDGNTIAVDKKISVGSYTTFELSKYTEIYDQKMNKLVLICIGTMVVSEIIINEIKEIINNNEILIEDINILKLNILNDILKSINKIINDIDSITYSDNGLVLLVSRDSVLLICKNKDKKAFVIEPSSSLFQNNYIATFGSGCTLLKMASDFLDEYDTVKKGSKEYFTKAFVKVAIYDKATSSNIDYITF